MLLRNHKTTVKSGIIADSCFWRASQHQTLASTPALFARYLSTCTCSLGPIRCHLSQIPYAKWVQRTMTALFHSTSPTSPPLTVTAVSLASPREAEGIHPLYPWSVVKAPQFGPTSRWHEQSWGCAWETKSEIRPSGDQISFCARLCARANARAGDPERFTWVVNDPHPTIWCAQRFGNTHLTT